MTEFSRINEIELIKKQGNIYFSEGDYKKACETFSEAISKSENFNNLHNLNDILSALYSNRSNCLLNLNLFQDAKNDAEKSILLNNFWYKGYIRKAMAFYKMKLFNEYEEFINIALDKTKNLDEQNEIEKLRNFNKIQKNKKINILSCLFKDKNTDENLSDKGVQDQHDWLMSQYIKPNEEDAFRSLGNFHSVEDGKLSKESANNWMKFGEKYGCGDSTELLTLLKYYITIEHPEEIKKVYEKIHDIIVI